MKKTYLIPTIKVLRMSEPLMVEVSPGGADGDFEEGAKDFDMNDDGFSPVFTNKSVWDD